MVLGERGLVGGIKIWSGWWGYWGPGGVGLLGEGGWLCLFELVLALTRWLVGQGFACFEAGLLLGWKCCC